MKNRPLIDLEVDSGSEQAETVAPSLLHQDLAALGEGGCLGGAGTESGPDSWGEPVNSSSLGRICPFLEGIGYTVRPLPPLFIRGSSLRGPEADDPPPDNMVRRSVIA